MNKKQIMIIASPSVVVRPCGCCEYAGEKFCCAAHSENMPQERPDTMKHLPDWVWNEKSVGELAREGKQSPACDGA